MEIATKTMRGDEARLVTFRPATVDDEAFLLEVYGSTRLEELALTNWGEAQRDAFLRMQFNAQQVHYRTHYPEGEHLIILLDGESIGRLYVANIPEEIRIIDITVLPASRNGGVGTSIITELTDEAKTLGKAVRIYVESFNPSLRLFERLGFVKTDESGYNYFLEWRSAD